MKLSIIVPVYNVEKYLCKCLDSLLNQKLLDEEYEIILVDDGSPDGSPLICDQYASRYGHVKVVHRQNGGLSIARNTGIEVAQGKFVQFVDSDDYLELNVLHALVQKMLDDDLDVLRFNYQNVNEQYEVFRPNKVNKAFVDYRDEICDGLTFLTERLGFGCYAWQFMVRRELLDNCLFKEGVSFEDTEWTPRLLAKAKRVTSTNIMVYNYLMRKGSITQSTDEKKKQKQLGDKLELIDSLQKQMREVSDKRWFEGTIAQIALSIMSYVSGTPYKKMNYYVNELRAKRIFPLSTFHATSFAKRKIILANLSPFLLTAFLHLKKSK